jgi:type 1 glutamine amidotransferase
LGHDVKALNIAGVERLFARGTAWAAKLAPQD